MLAIELGCRGVPCVLIEANLKPPTAPKANATSARTMEHLPPPRLCGPGAGRRPGGGPPAGRAVLHPAGLGCEIARFKIPSRCPGGQPLGFWRLRRERTGPRPNCRTARSRSTSSRFCASQVAQLAFSVDARYGWRVDSRCSDAGRRGVGSRPPQTVDRASASHVKARYVVGCDAARSLVRTHDAGVGYAGASDEQRDFFGGQMLSIHFRSQRAVCPPVAKGALKRPAWQSWVMNRELRGILVAINGVDEFGMGIQLKPGQIGGQCGHCRRCSKP